MALNSVFIQNGRTVFDFETFAVYAKHFFFIV